MSSTGETLDLKHPYIYTEERGFVYGKGVPELKLSLDVRYALIPFYTKGDFPSFPWRGSFSSNRLSETGHRFPPKSCSSLAQKEGGITRSIEDGHGKRICVVGIQAGDIELQWGSLHVGDADIARMVVTTKVTTKSIPKAISRTFITQSLLVVLSFSSNRISDGGLQIITLVTSRTTMDSQDMAATMTVSAVVVGGARRKPIKRCRITKGLTMEGSP
ncbi:uncharacterized protein ARMOST_02710 [Armillaria ostoyae]|uniref:Uncharacterized protein n=1 Tax=Armillaria ostoyae TaxID=47428 RepID=A0A284QSQ2_ARMOS|nr:uncharacterized protein ARMOST_02710 [Armillaria ostoyae]